MNIQPGTVIVNADDFGYSSDVNKAIMTCFDRGLISSTTIMANMPGFEEARDMAIANQRTKCIGVHLNLTEGWPLLPELQSNQVLCDETGRFRRFRSLVLSRKDRSMITAEVSAQIRRCRVAGLPITHADSHQHVHNEPMVFMAIHPVLKRFGIPHLRIARNMDRRSVLSPKRVVKSCFNHWVASRGLRGTTYFGTVENFEHFKTADRLATNSFEILTHPSFDQYGTLIDQLDKLPLEKRLANAFRGLRLSSYRCEEIRTPVQRGAA